MSKSGFNYILDPIQRDLSKISQSKPKNVLKLLKNYRIWIESDNFNVCPVDLFITKYLNAVSKTNGKLRNELYPPQKNDEDRYNPEFNRFEELKQEIYKALLQLEMIENGNIHINESKPIADWIIDHEYPEYEVDIEIDKLYPNKSQKKDLYCMVIDRDQFSKDRDDQPRNDLPGIRKECQNNGYFMIVTNPYFELWVALHTENYNDEEMLHQMKQYLNLYTKKKKTTREERESVGPLGYLKSKVPQYKKNVMNYSFINEEGLDRAIKNLKEYYKTDLENVMRKVDTDDFSAMGSNILDILEM